jgi:retron-type reverse transcriptase
MKGREQKISKDTCLQNSRAEPESYAGGQTFIWITENNLTNTDRPEYGMLEQILSPSNLNRAYKRVRSNKGSGGVDKMEVESLKDYLVRNKDQLIQSILDGKYRPNPVRRVEISKEKGTRSLGIPKLLSYYMSSQFVLGMFSYIPIKYL